MNSTKTIIDEKYVFRVRAVGERKIKKDFPSAARVNRTENMLAVEGRKVVNQKKGKSNKSGKVVK